MNRREKDQISQGLNIYLFSAFTRACNAAEAVEAAAEGAYSINVAGIVAFVQYDNLAFEARAAAVALAGILAKESVYYSYISRRRIAVALSRLQRATAAAEDAARRAGKRVAPATGYPQDVTPAQILDSVEYAWTIIGTFDAAGENSAPARAKLAELQGVIVETLTLDYDKPYVLTEIAEPFVCSMNRANAALKALHKVAEEALRRVQDAR